MNYFIQHISSLKINLFLKNSYLWDYLANKNLYIFVMRALNAKPKYTHFSHVLGKSSKYLSFYN